MALTFAKLREEAETATIAYGGEELHVTYNAAAYTPKLERQAMEVMAGDNKSTYFAVMLASMLMDWDLKDGQKKYPITLEALEELPFKFLSHVLQELTGRILPNQTNSADSSST